MILSRAKSGHSDGFPLKHSRDFRGVTVSGNAFFHSDEIEMFEHKICTNPNAVGCIHATTLKRTRCMHTPNSSVSEMTNSDKQECKLCVVLFAIILPTPLYFAYPKFFRNEQVKTRVSEQTFQKCGVRTPASNLGDVVCRCVYSIYHCTTAAAASAAQSII